jgi:hypothetical protein
MTPMPPKRIFQNDCSVMGQLREALVRSAVEYERAAATEETLVLRSGGVVLW